MAKNLLLLSICLILASPGAAGKIIPLDAITNPGYSFQAYGNELFLVNGHSIFIYDLDLVECDRFSNQ